MSSSLIVADGLTKRFKRADRRPGIGGALPHLARPSVSTVTAVDEPGHVRRSHRVGVHLGVERVAEPVRASTSRRPFRTYAGAPDIASRVCCTLERTRWTGGRRLFGVAFEACARL